MVLLANHEMAIGHSRVEIFNRLWPLVFKGSITFYFGEEVVFGGGGYFMFFI